MIKLDENGKLTYTDPISDRHIPCDYEIPVPDTERIEALEAAILELAEVVLNG